MDRIQRYELKYAFPAQHVTHFRQDLLCFMKEDPYNHQLGHSRGYPIRSLYFESNDLGSYEEKMAGISLRTKLRVRAYLPISDESRFAIEIKQKENGVILKGRSLSLDAEDISNLMAGAYLKVLKKYPDNLFLQRFISEKIRRRLDFSFIVDYDREAFVNLVNSRYVRVNLDRNLRFLPAKHFFDNEAKGLDDYYGQKSILCEFKYENTAPHWMPYLIQKYELQLAPFSKFAEGVGRSWNRMGQHFQNSSFSFIDRNDSILSPS